MPPAELRALADRIRGEFIEMPGLHLTMAQAVRLWGLDEMVCSHVVNVLVRSQFLRWTPTGAIARLDS